MAFDYKKKFAARKSCSKERSFNVGTMQFKEREREREREVFPEQEDVEEREGKQKANEEGDKEEEDNAQLEALRERVLQ